MKIDLAQPSSLTQASVRRLLAEGNDRVHNQLRVSEAGIAWLSTEAVGGASLAGVRFRLETWAAGSGCVGLAASEDEIWVRQILEVLRQNWPDPSSDYIDLY